MKEPMKLLQRAAFVSDILKPVWLSSKEKAGGCQAITKQVNPLKINANRMDFMKPPSKNTAMIHDKVTPSTVLDFMLVFPSTTSSIFQIDLFIFFPRHFFTPWEVTSRVDSVARARLPGNEGEAERARTRLDWLVGLAWLRAAGRCDPHPRGSCPDVCTAALPSHAAGRSDAEPRCALTACCRALGG